MADGSLIFDTGIDTAGFEQGTKRLKAAGATAAKTLAAGFATTTAALGGLGTYAVRVGSQFEASMSQVAATMGLTASEIAAGSKDYELLEKAAKAAGSTTKFSASESAEALNYLALAGYDAAKSVATLPTVLNLAAAGGLDLAYASDMVTDSMSALGEMAGTTTEFADKLAKASQKSNTSVAQLGEAILTVGGTAKDLAGGTTELNTALGILADNGVKGAEGGTALRNMILSLSAPTNTAAKKMQELGLEVFDAQGNLRPLNEIFQDLHNTLGTMTSENRTKVLSELFNKVDLKSVNALLDNCGGRFDELSGYIDAADGAAAAMAETMNDNLKGRLAEFNSALEGLGINLYANIANPLKDAVELATGYIGQLSGLFSGEGVSIGDMTEWFRNNPQALEDYKQQIDTFIEAGMTAEEATEKARDKIKQIIGMSKIPETVGEITTDALKKMAQAAPQVVETTMEIMAAMLGSLEGESDEIVEAGGDILLALAKGISKLIPQLMKIAVQIMVSLVKYLWNNKGEIYQAADDIVNGLVQGIKQGLGTIAEVGKQVVFGFIEGMKSGAGQLASYVEGWSGDILKKVTDFFVIKSPSRLFRDKVGKMLGLGVQVGLSSTENLIVDTMKAIGERLVDAGVMTQDKLLAMEQKKGKERAEKMRAYRIAEIDASYNAYMAAERARLMEKQARLEEIELALQQNTNNKKLLAEQETLQQEIGLLEEFQGNYTSTYNEMVSAYEQAYDTIMSKQETLETKLAAFGQLYDTIKDADGKDTGRIKLADLQGQLDTITQYGNSLEALKKKGSVTQEFLDEILAMSIDDGLNYMQLLLEQTDTDFDAYLTLWKEKQKKSKEIAQRYYKDQFDTLKRDFNDKIDKQMGLLPDKAKTIGLNSSKNLADGLKANSGLVFSAIDDLIGKFIQMEAAANAAQAAADEAAGAQSSYTALASYSVTNNSRSLTNNVSFNSPSSPTPAETYRAIIRAGKELAY